VRSIANLTSDRPSGLDNAQSLHHFLTESPWQSQHLRQQRLLILQTLGEREIVLVIDDTVTVRGSTQITSSGSTSAIWVRLRSIVVTAYGVVDNIPCHYCLRFINRKAAQTDDIYRSKPEIAAEMMRNLQSMGFLQVSASG